MPWIDLAAVWKIIVFGLIAGAGLPAIFAIGMFCLSRGPRLQTAGAGTARGAGGAGAPAGGDSDAIVGGSPVGMAGAAICFLIVLAAIGWGIYEIYRIGHPSH